MKACCCSAAGFFACKYFVKSENRMKNSVTFQWEIVEYNQAAAIDAENNLC